MARQRAAERKRSIVEAARACFLQFGWAKTSLDDIARRAGVSRPLIYRLFANKDAVFAAVFDALFDEKYAAVEAILAGRGSRRDKLSGACELLVAAPWEQVAGAPMVSELFDVCARLFPAVGLPHVQRRLRYVRTILGDKDEAELFLLAVDGLQSDLPEPALLRRRLARLIAHFA